MASRLGFFFLHARAVCRLGYGSDPSKNFGAGEILALPGAELAGQLYPGERFARMGNNISSLARDGASPELEAVVGSLDIGMRVLRRDLLLAI